MKTTLVEKLTEANSGTVDTFLTVLKSKLTQYDKSASSRRGYNPHAMALYLEAAQDVESDVAHVKYKDDADSIKLFIRSVMKHFDPVFPPIKNVLSQAQAFVSSGTLPRL